MSKIKTKSPGTGASPPTYATESTDLSEAKDESMYKRFARNHEITAQSHEKQSNNDKLSDEVRALHKKAAEVHNLAAMHNHFAHEVRKSPEAKGFHESKWVLDAASSMSDRAQEHSRKASDHIKA